MFVKADQGLTPHRGRRDRRVAGVAQRGPCHNVTVKARSSALAPSLCPSPEWLQ